MISGTGTGNARILVFDSGIGGMGVVRALHDLSPSLQIDYLADTALFPYGEKPDSLLTARILSLLTAGYEEFRPDLLVIACNTASTLALPVLRERLSVPIVGCVPPIRWAGRVSRTRTIGLLSTSATARRPYVADLREKFAADCRLIVHGARALADLAERGFLGETLPPEAIREELSQLFRQEGGDAIDTIGLGCTHYTFLMPDFLRLALPAITWLDPAPAVARQALTVLSQSIIPERTLRDPRLMLTSAPRQTPKLEQAFLRLGYRSWEIADPSATRPNRA